MGSALGFLLAPASFEVVRSFSSLRELNLDAVASLVEEMRDEAVSVVNQMSSGHWKKR